MQTSEIEAAVVEATSMMTRRGADEIILASETPESMRTPEQVRLVELVPQHSAAPAQRYRLMGWKLHTYDYTQPVAIFTDLATNRFVTISLVTMEEV